MYTELDDRQVNILGTDYSIVFVKADSQKKTEKAADGYIDPTTKEIYIGIFKPDAKSCKDLDSYQRRIMRHEIIHAFLFECGLWTSSNSVNSWATNEEMVDWFAIQHNKIHKAFEKAGAL